MMKKVVFLCTLILGIIQTSHARAVDTNKNSKENDSEVIDDLDQYMEYHRYLKEVVNALESDSDFREKLEKANEDDIKTGRIAEQLDFVNHNVRSKLDEIKRRELERLRHLATKEYELTNDIDPKVSKVQSSAHLDHENPHTFEIEDLKKLIKKTTEDLAEADRKRREEFKAYEMEKEFEKHQKIEKMDETQKKEFEQKEQKEKEAVKQHPPLHHPGSKQQLEEVWEKQDHMDSQQFDPKVFFMMHDVDGNGFWDADEVKALFIKELDKMYGSGKANSDPRERAEEMERMREHVFMETDTNRDGLIDFNEFMVQTQRSDFQKDQGWQPIDQNSVYTPEEYQSFEQKRLAELKYLQEHGYLDAYGRPVPGAYQHIPQTVYQQAQQAYRQPQYQQQPYYQQQGMQQGQYVNPQQMQPGQYQQGYPAQQQVPQNYQQQVPVGAQGQAAYGQLPVQQGQVPIQQGQVPIQQGQVPIQQGQVPIQQGQVPIQQGQIPMQQGQMPSQQGRMPVQQGQVPVQQGQVPVQQGQAQQQQVPPQQAQASAQGQVPVQKVQETQIPQGQRQ